MTAMFGGCDCNASLGDACATAADCEAGETCVDSRCVARTDTGPGGEDAGEDPVDANLPDLGTPDVPPGLDTGPADAFCGGGTVEIDYRAPNVMVILDRSCSMRRRVDMPGEFGTGPDDTRTRWNQAASAVLSLVRADETRIFWGLMAFPDSREGCGDDVSAEVLPVLFSWHCDIELNELAGSYAGGFAPERFWNAWDRGGNTTVDVVDADWDFWGAAPVDLEELRAEYAIRALDPALAA